MMSQIPDQLLQEGGGDTPELLEDPLGETTILHESHINHASFA